MTACPLSQLLGRKARPKILVVGDVMLDRYQWGDVDRISPEAPIPVLKVDRREDRLGGAGSVVSMLAALECEVALAAVLADDAEATIVRWLLERHGAATEALVVDPGRSTTVKERFLGRTQSRHPQQIIRVDREQTLPIGETVVERLLAAIEPLLARAEAILVSDYNKGVCSEALVARLAAAARSRGIPLVADPARGASYDRYRGATAVTPNRVEAGLAVGRKIDSIAAGLEAAGRLLEYDIDAAVVKLDRDGMVWAHRDGRRKAFATRARQVFDVTGAGDMVLSALGYALALGADWPAAIELANLAGGVEVERLGVAPVSREELLGELFRGGFSTDHKVVSVEKLLDDVRDRRRLGQRIVMTNGCFDLLHPGHVASLQYARNQGDCLVVGVNSDRSVRSLKGPNRPVVGEQGRADMLAALECVDYVVIFDETSVEGLVEKVAPDILVKSAEYRPEQIVGSSSVHDRGGKVALAPVKGEYSTTSLINRIRRMLDDYPDAE